MPRVKRPRGCTLDTILRTGGPGFDKLGLAATEPGDEVVGVLPREYHPLLHVRMAIIRHMFEIVKLERVIYLAHAKHHNRPGQCTTPECEALKRRLDEIDQEMFRNDDRLRRHDASFYKLLKKLYGAEPGMEFQFRRGFKVVKTDEDDEDPSITYVLMWS